MAAIAVIAAGGSCTPETGPAHELVTRRDSSGVALVRISVLEDVAASLWKTNEVGSTSRKVDLFRVAGARILPDGSIAVANAGTNEILILDDEGALLRRLGRGGQAPGEFRWITRLDAGRDGTLFVYDRSNLSWTHLAPSGEVLATARLHPPIRTVEIYPLGSTASGDLLAIFNSQNRFIERGTRRDTTPLLKIDLAVETLDTIALWPGREWTYKTSEIGRMRASPGFGPDILYSGRMGKVALGDPEGGVVTVYDRRPRPMVIFRIDARRTPTTAEVSLWRRQMEERYRDAPLQLKNFAHGIPPRDTFPAFGGVLLDAVGRLWVGSYSSPAAETALWVVFSDRGHPVGRITLPAGSELLDADTNRMILLQRNSVDEERLSIVEFGPRGDSR